MNTLTPFAELSQPPIGTVAHYYQADVFAQVRFILGFHGQTTIQMRRLDEIIGQKLLEDVEAWLDSLESYMKTVIKFVERLSLVSRFALLVLLILLVAALVIGLLSLVH